MPPQFCFGCGCLAEAPRIVVRDARPVVLCEQCPQAEEPTSEVARHVAAGIRCGAICPACDQPMQRPGGTTPWNRGRTRLIRVCFDCKTLAP